MAYDATFPADHAELDGGPFRNQFNALKALNDAQAAQTAALQALVNTQAGQIAALQTALNAKASMDDVNAALAPLQGEIDAVPSTDAVNAMIGANSAGNVSVLDMLDVHASNPPTQAEVNQIVSYVNALVSTLKRL